MKKSDQKSCPYCGGKAVPHMARKFDKRGIDPDFPQKKVHRCTKCRRDDVFNLLTRREPRKLKKAKERPETAEEKKAREDAEAERYARDDNKK